MRKTSRCVRSGGKRYLYQSTCQIAGMLSTTSGYIGGTVANPTYQQVSGKDTGHAVAVEIVFDLARVSYAALVEKFWRTVDPTTNDR